MNSEILLQHIRKRFYNKSFNVFCCARELNLSESHLREIANSNFNTSPQQLIETVRLETAIKMFSEINAPIYSVCSKIGYSTQKPFRQAVKKRFNLSPKELKEKIKKSKNVRKNSENIIKELWDSLNHTSDFDR
jgi:AraC-like DNA-binding protein